MMGDLETKLFDEIDVVSFRDKEKISYILNLAKKQYTIIVQDADLDNSEHKEGYVYRTIRGIIDEIRSYEGMGITTSIGAPSKCDYGYFAQKLGYATVSSLDGHKRKMFSKGVLRASLSGLKILDDLQAIDGKLSILEENKRSSNYMFEHARLFQDKLDF